MHVMKFRNKGSRICHLTCSNLKVGERKYLDSSQSTTAISIGPLEYEPSCQVLTEWVSRFAIWNFNAISSKKKQEGILDYQVLISIMGQLLMCWTGHLICLFPFFLIFFYKRWAEYRGSWYTEILYLDADWIYRLEIFSILLLYSCYTCIFCFIYTSSHFVLGNGW